MQWGLPGSLIFILILIRNGHRTLLELEKDAGLLMVTTWYF
jgi:hypothetical protein